MPARNPEAVRQRAIEAAHQRTGRPATPSLDPVVVALNHGELPIRARTGEELAQRVRRAEDYAALGARVVVELHSESHAAKPGTRAWAVTRRAQRAHRHQADRHQRSDRRQADRASRTDRPRQQERGWLPMPDYPDDPTHPDQLDGQARFRADLVTCLDSLLVGELAGLLGELPSSRREPLQRANDAADRHGAVTTSGSVGWHGEVAAGIASKP